MLTAFTFLPYFITAVQCALISIPALYVNVAERGEKLERLGDKTNDLRDGALNFYEQAKALRKKQESSWF